MKMMIIALAALACGMFSVWGAQVAGQAPDKRYLSSEQSRLAQEVRHQLIMLPAYSVFDNLEFEVSGVDAVTLLGQVLRPSLKSDAERVVRGLEGVGMVVNKIEVLPIAPNDEKIRMDVYRAFISKPGLGGYFIRAVPPIHIIVKNGAVTLVGAVATFMDKELAGQAAKEVPGTLGVTNNLRVDHRQAAVQA